MNTKSQTNMRVMINRGESSRLEFKESLILFDQIGKAVSAFSNTKGGKVLVGVGDTGIIRGVDIGKNTIENLANDIKRNTDNSLYPEILVEKADGKQIIIIGIGESDEKPVFFKGSAYKRVGKTSQKLNASEIRSLAKNNGEKKYWDEQICDGATLRDIDKGKLISFLNIANQERNLNADPNLSLSDSLTRLNLIRHNNLTNAAILLFGKTVDKYFIHSKIKCARFKGTNSLDYIDMKLFSGTIIELRNNALNFIMQHIKHAVYFDSNKRNDLWEYPLRAIEEVLSNALAHRDYQKTRSEIQISIFDDRIEFWNPGELPKPLKPEDLIKKHRSIPRNPKIAEMLFLIKYIEKWGKGTNRIADEMKSQKLPLPSFENLSGGFEVILNGPGKQFDNLPESKKTGEETRGETRVKIIELMLLNPKITTKELSDKIGISLKGVEWNLKILRTDNKIRRVGPKKGGHWEVAKH